MNDAQSARAARLEMMREALKLQYSKPVLPVPQGAALEGRVVAVYSGDEAARMRVVVEANQAVHVIGVATDTARQLLGDRVEVRNEHGSLSLTQLERKGPDYSAGRAASGQGADRTLADGVQRVDFIRVR